MQLFAPYPNEQTVTILPDPQLQNDVGVVEENQFVVMMDKSVYGYTKSTGLLVHSYTFHLTREKSEEVREFLDAYISEKWRIVDHNGVSIVGYCISEPNEFRYVHPHAGMPAKATGYSINEKIVWDLEFEEATV